MTTKRMAEIIEELAETEGKSSEQFLLDLADAAETRRRERFEGYPPEIRSELVSAETLRREAREERRRQSDKSDFDAQVKAFLGLFPDVKAEEISETVWKDVSEGIPLAYAYAHSLVLPVSGGTSDEVNAANEARAFPVTPGRAEETSFTEEEVERMAPAAVKSNFSKIISSMKKWRN